MTRRHLKKKASLVAGLAILIAPGLAAARDVGVLERAQFRVGVATYQEVTRALGQPTSVTVRIDGARTIIYSSALSPRPVTFTPIAETDDGGAASNSATIFAFWPSGVLRGTSTTNANVACSAHLFSIRCHAGALARPSGGASHMAAGPEDRQAVRPIALARRDPIALPPQRCRLIYSPTDPSSVTCRTPTGG
jgi:hypothetical protein